MNYNVWCEGKQILNRIDALKECLKSFEEFPSQREGEENKIYTREPKVIIERIDEEWDGRDSVKVPVILNSEITQLLKVWLNSELENALTEFDHLK